MPQDGDSIRVAIDELLTRNAHVEATVRLVLSGGPSPDGMRYDPATPTFLILTHELHEPPPGIHERGVGLMTVDQRRELPRAKTTNYLTMLKHRPEADARGAFDLLYHSGGYVTEAASATVHLVRGGRILVPEDDVLPGTISAFVLNLARQRYEIAFGAVTLAEAFSADEVFITSTTRGVVPIVRLDETPIGSGSPGAVTRDLIALYRQALSNL